VTPGINGQFNSIDDGAKVRRIIPEMIYSTSSLRARGERVQCGTQPGIRSDMSNYRANLSPIFGE